MIVFGGMNMLKQILAANPLASVYGTCRRCGKRGQSNPIKQHWLARTIYPCPYCHSVNFRIDLVTRIEATGYKLTLFKRSK